MALIPIATTQQRLRPLDAPARQAADFSAGGEAIGRAAQRLGDAGARLAADMDQLDAARDEATAKLLDTEFSSFERTTLWDPEKGFYSQQGQNAINARAATEQALQQKRRELLERAESPRARAMLQGVLDRRLGSSLESVGRYAVQQTERFERDASNARIAGEVENAVAFRDQPERFEASLDTIRDEVISRGQREGWSVELIKQEQLKAVSDVHVKVIDALAIDDPAEAKRYADIHASEMQPTAKLAVDKLLAGPLEEQEADRVVDAIRGTGSALPPGPVGFDALAVAVEGQESRGRNGLVSPKGAAGVMQVMPGTAKEISARLGIPYDPERLRTDPEYCRRLGREYLAQQLKRYGGNTTLALAAYNAGPGAVDKWIETIGDPRKGEISDAEFAQRIPFAETRAYVPGVLKRVGGGGPRNAPRENDVAGQLAKLDAMRETLAPGVYDKARQGILTADSIDKRLLADQQQRAADEAWTIALQPGFTSTTQIPRSLWGTLAPSTQRSLAEAAAANAKGADPAPNPRLYVQLSDMASKQPEKFSGLNLAAYAHQLPKGDWEQFVTLQRSVRQAGTKAPEFVTAERIRSTTNDLALGAGLTIKGLKGSKLEETAKLLADFRSAVARDARNFVAREKREPTDDEIRAMADKWLVKVRVVGADDDDAVFQFEVPAGKRVAVDLDDVPEADQAEIKAALAARGRPATDDEIRRIYLKSKNEVR